MFKIFSYLMPLFLLFSCSSLDKGNSLKNISVQPILSSTGYMPQILTNTLSWALQVITGSYDRAGEKIFYTDILHKMQKEGNEYILSINCSNVETLYKDECNKEKVSQEYIRFSRYNNEKKANFDCSTFTTPENQVKCIQDQKDSIEWIRRKSIMDEAKNGNFDACDRISPVITERDSCKIMAVVLPIVQYEYLRTISGSVISPTNSISVVYACSDLEKYDLATQCEAKERELLEFITKRTSGSGLMILEK